jgi:hypothetical protein
LTLRKVTTLDDRTLGVFGVVLGLIRPLRMRIRCPNGEFVDRVARAGMRHPDQLPAGVPGAAGDAVEAVAERAVPDGRLVRGDADVHGADSADGAHAAQLNHRQHDARLPHVRHATRAPL